MAWPKGKSLSPEHRAKARAAVQNPEARAKSDAAHRTLDGRTQQSANAKKLWNDPEKAAALALRRKAMWQDPEYRQKTSENRRGIPVSAEQRKKLSKAGKGKPKSEEWRAKMSITLRERWAKLSPEERRDRLKNATYNASLSQKPTSIERSVQGVLDDLGIEYSAQYRYGPYYFDFFIPSLKMDIECDGSYWHSLPKAIEKDRLRDRWLARHRVRVCRLTENEIKADARQAVRRVLESGANP